MDPDEQKRLILDQFTRQAEPFARKPELSNDEIFRLLLNVCEVTKDDEVLDVACGPGLTSCALAGVAKQVIGLDITPAMVCPKSWVCRSIAAWRRSFATRIDSRSVTIRAASTALRRSSSNTVAMAPNSSLRRDASTSVVMS